MEFREFPVVTKVVRLKILRMVPANNTEIRILKRFIASRKVNSQSNFFNAKTKIRIPTTNANEVWYVKSESKMQIELEICRGLDCDFVSNIIPKSPRFMLISGPSSTAHNDITIMLGLTQEVKNMAHAIAYFGSSRVLSISSERSNFTIWYESKLTETMENK